MAKVTFKQEPITLKGEEVKQGDTAPDFKVLGNDLSEVTLKDFDGKKKILNVVPSLDTPVCDQQARKFNEEASTDENGVVLTISADLPFAQKRWCAASGLDNVLTVSDHKDLDFGMNYGVVMEELRLLARSVFVLDQNNEIVHAEIVSEGTDFPDFDKALEAYNNIK
ncbi:thiol peroxidase [Staphylococcus massiliensis]|uniref:Thiol peroxidase n=1 Tax=Staphylococcus massiliensis S46 TaxID=1229783 RepID=K9ASB1_9STAP|nr:thiol peroxidase [Staphylococcus massiliensis]EKU50219.1 lipid hydroperoxide peroxidase [Staphylococcus massiliensis S46]MCG3399754.1 thiol peroxidase [Staphylococcus massiliensis]MCG3400859.1 thiol peroxidase [Staphylococcus massiliensis]MCG3411977.1 thiol peroxidase [Staphylococcus massiliensis]POA00028.1 thiol peroxidase [Staphylococcus massiliensis CCUG 55927]